jgi:hypothetical protein
MSNNYPYNEPIFKSPVNGLNIDSHVKCDLLFIYCEYIIPDKVIKFDQLESKYASNINIRSANAMRAKNYFYIDQ